LVANPGGIFCAMESRSTHRGKDLSEGKIVIYPYRARFDVTNGKLIAAPRIGFIRMKTTTATAMSPGWTVAT